MIVQRLFNPTAPDNSESRPLRHPQHARSAVPKPKRCSQLVKSRSIQLISCIASLALTSCSPPTVNEVPAILLVNGTGASHNDIKAVEAILKKRHLTYAIVNSQQLNA